MKRIILMIACSFGLCAAATGWQAQPKPVSFHRQIRPILQKRCQGCHQPVTQGGKMVLTTYQAFRAGGVSGAGFKPGEPDSSVVMRFITGNPPLMPKNQKALSQTEVGFFRRWILEGAKDDTPAFKDPIDQLHPPVYTAAPVIPALAWSIDGKALAVAGYREVLLHRADGTGLIARLVGRSPRVESLAYSPDGKLLAAVGGAPAEFGEVQLWDTATNKQAAAAELSYDVVYGASFAPDGQRLAIGGAENSVRIVSVPELKTLVKFDNHSDWIFATSWSMPDVKQIGAEIAKYAQGTTNRPGMPEETLHILTTGRDRAIKLIVAKNASFVDDINTHTSPYRSMAAHPKTNHVLVAGDDKIPRLYQIYRTKPRTMNQEDQGLTRAFETQPAQVNAVAFSPDGARLAVGGDTGEIRVYSTEDGKRLAAMKGGEGPVYTLAFRPDGLELATAGFDGQVRLFDPSTGKINKAFVAVPLSKPAAASKSSRAAR